MNKLFSLLRASMTDGMRIFIIGGKDEKKRHILLIAVIIMAFMAIFGSAYAMTRSLAEEGLQYGILALYVMVTTILTVMEGIYKSSSLLFNCHDNDLLLSLPVKKSTITFVRIFKFYVFELFYNTIFLGPAILAYLLNTDVDASFYLVAVMMILLLPIIPVVISCLIGVITSSIATRFKKRPLVEVFLSLLSLVIVLVLVFFLGQSDGLSNETIKNLSNNITGFYYPADAFVRLATNFDILEFLKFIAINLLVFAIVVAVIGKFYFSIVTKVNVVKRSGNNNQKLIFKRRSQTWTMVRKELRKYFNTPVLVSNTAIGLVLFLVAVVALCFKFNDAVGLLGQQGDFPITPEEALSYAPGVNFILVTFSSVMTFITTTSISLEGRSFNILKTMPISGVKVFFSKILASVLLVAPVMVLGSILMFARFQFGFFDFLLILIASVLMPLVTETAGIFVDIKYARFNADSDAEIVKQSPGVMVSSFLGLGITVFTMSITVLLIIFVGQTLGIAIVDLLYAVILLILCFTLKNYGDQKYLELSA